MREVIGGLLAANGGVVARRDHPELGGQFDWLVRRGELVSILPGVLAAADGHTELSVRVRAAMLWKPDAVVVGRTAAALTYWPRLPVTDVELAQVDDRRTRAGFTTSRRRIPPELVLTHGTLRLSSPALAAVDLCGALGGDAIDVALRSRQVRLADLEEALSHTAGRGGHPSRRRLLLDSRDEPWSEAERRAHLHQAGIAGWRANHPVTVRDRRYYVDLAFPGSRVVLEIDGRLHHSDAEAFEGDRRRQNDLVLAGWRVLRFTWRMLIDDPDAVVAAIRTATAARAA